MRRMLFIWGSSWRAGCARGVRRRLRLRGGCGRAPHLAGSALATPGMVLTEAQVVNLDIRLYAY